MPIGYGDILFFAIVAIFLAFKFFSILGRKEGEDTIERLKSFGASKFPQPEAGLGNQKIYEKPTQAKTVEEEKDPYEGIVFANDAAKDGVIEIAERDTSFNIKNFIAGASSAFEMVCKAYTDNDTATLKILLSDELYNSFNKKLDGFFRQNQKNILSLVSVKVVEVAGANLFGSNAKIVLKLQSEQINFTKDESGNVIEGSTNAIDVVDDEWTFERNIKSSSPNWLITEL